MKHYKSNHVANVSEVAGIRWEKQRCRDVTEVRRVSRDDASLGHPKDLEDGSNVLLGGFGWMPKPVSPLPPSPTAVDEREEDALSIASSMPPFKFLADVEEGESISRLQGLSFSHDDITVFSHDDTGIVSRGHTPFSCTIWSDRYADFTSDPQDATIATTQVPKLATIVEYIQTSTWVDGVMIGRGTLFYKRRLAGYDFTVYELGTRDGFCYFHHEGIAKRGATEIASNLFNYLSILDEQRKEEVSLFSDGCIGQNKNCILPAMLMYFLAESLSVTKITLYYFETSHGQSEGESIHSTIERALKNTGDLFLPCQLAMLILGARKNPKRYHVTEVQTMDIRDWKALSQSMHILMVRTTAEGNCVDWKKVMQVEVRKSHPKKAHGEVFTLEGRL